jgi:hypothetical protein
MAATAVHLDCITPSQLQGVNRDGGQPSVPIAIGDAASWKEVQVWQQREGMQRMSVNRECVQQKKVILQEILLVDDGYRRRGVGRAALQRARPVHVWWRGGRERGTHHAADADGGKHPMPSETWQNCVPGVQVLTPD